MYILYDMKTRLKIVCSSPIKIDLQFLTGISKLQHCLLGVLEKRLWEISQVGYASIATSPPQFKFRFLFVTKFNIFFAVYSLFENKIANSVLVILY